MLTMHAPLSSLTIGFAERCMLTLLFANKYTYLFPQVALKVMKMDTSDDDEYETFMREIDAVVALNEQVKRPEL